MPPKPKPKPKPEEDEWKKLKNTWDRVGKFLGDPTQYLNKEEKIQKPKSIPGGKPKTKQKK